MAFFLFLRVDRSHRTIPYNMDWKSSGLIKLWKLVPDDEAF